MNTKQTEVLKLALEALEDYVEEYGPHEQDSGVAYAITAIREALAKQPAPPPECKTDAEKTAFAFGWWKALEENRKQSAQQEPMATMPSNTRYTVEVEGHGQTYWDNIHDAITNAQRAVYSGSDNTARALDDLKAGRIAEWSYGFSAVRIYPPQNASPQPAQQELEELTAQRDQLADILTRTANALKGQPAELSSHSWHDLPEVAQQIKAAQQQEPVAVYVGETWGGSVVRLYEDLPLETPLYTSPPASKPWVGLTDEDILRIKGQFKGTLDVQFDKFAYAIEAKLREKNA